MLGVRWLSWGDLWGLQGSSRQEAPSPQPGPGILKTLDCQTTHSNREVLQNCSLVFFATKPHVLPSVLAEVAPVVTAEHILVSVAAGISLSLLEEVSDPRGSFWCRVLG